jgi:3-isopropylmalate/(R)-2-methylmalate dehydratase small subunit
MRPVTVVTGPAAPLLQANIDTDVIIRIERLTGGADLAHYAFEALRYLPDGSPNPECIFNEQHFAKAPILLAGRNFGCGSSREGAVTALMAMGLRCIIAPSFGDIFFANSFRNGLLPIVLSEDTVKRLAAESGTGDFHVDLAAQLVRAPSGETISFPIDALRRETLLEGLDEIGLTLKDGSEIAAWQTVDQVNRPWVWCSGIAPAFGQMGRDERSR